MDKEISRSTCCMVKSQMFFQPTQTQGDVLHVFWGERTYGQGKETPGRNVQPGLLANNEAPACFAGVCLNPPANRESHWLGNVSDQKPTGEKKSIISYCLLSSASTDASYIILPTQTCTIKWKPFKTTIHLHCLIPPTNGSHFMIPVIRVARNFMGWTFFAPFTLQNIPLGQQICSPSPVQYEQWNDNHDLLPSF